MITASWKTGLTSEEIIFGLVVSVALTLILFYLIFYYLKRARLIEDTPTSRIRSAAQGYVELIGGVSAGEAGELAAPLSGTPCVWFDYKIERYRKGKHGHWYTIDQGTSEQWFQIDDRTGVCTIDPQGAHVITEHKRVWHGNTENPNRQTNDDNSFLRKLSGRRYRYTEHFIYIHDVIYALGNFQSIGGGRNIPSNQRLTGNVIREWKENYDWIIQNFDKDGNGEIDMNEWASVRESATQEAEKRRADLSAAPTVHLLTNSPNKRHPFIISNRSQKTLAKRFRIYATSAFAGCLVCAYFVVVLAI